MKEKILEMESRTMQNYPLFFGIDEQAEDLCDGSFREDTKLLLKRFIGSQITFEEGNSLDLYAITFERVHRLGRPKFDRVGRL